MKKLLILILMLTLTFTGCITFGPLPAETPDPTAEAFTPTEAPTSLPTPMPTGTPNLSAPYEDSGRNYTYTMTDKRDRDWEEDIVFFADEMLHPFRGHPMLADRVTSTGRYNENLKRYSQTGTDNFFDPELKALFIESVNELIVSIPDKTDAEIRIGLMKIAAMLNDVHTKVSATFEEGFPIWLVPVEYGGELAAFILQAPKASSELLGKRLTAINGVPVEEIAEMMRPMLTYENDWGFFCNAYSCYYLMNCDHLRSFGVIGRERSAVFTAVGIDGVEVNCKVVARPLDSLWSNTQSYHEVNGVGYGETMLSKGSTLYFRINSCRVDESFRDILNDAFDEANSTDKLEKIIIDMRGNHGGYIDLDGCFLSLAVSLEATDADIYLIIDCECYSAAVGIPAMLKQRIEKLILVGSPTGQPVRFFAGGWDKELPNSGIGFSCSGGWNDFWPGNDGDALMPDITVFESYEDYLNGVDSVLYALLNGET